MLNSTKDTLQRIDELFSKKRKTVKNLHLQRKAVELKQKKIGIGWTEPVSRTKRVKPNSKAGYLKW
jgi:hypothetical protein